MSIKPLRVVVAILLLLISAACREGTEPQSDEPGPSVPAGPSLLISSPQDGDEVEGPVRLEMDVTGIQIVPANGDASGRTGHYHIFVDRDPVPVGQPIPMEETIIHTANNPIEIDDLPPGMHRLTVVLGDGNHVRIHEVQSSVNITVKERR
ncbi:MAG: DUF4399 domain-containing protein [Actinomycetota bacterium]|nr:DUF4399 domain-containing protein [Actinomycetota bacterium]